MAVSTSSVDGRVESIADGAIRGWAWDGAQSGARLEITVWLDGVQIAQGTADQSAAGAEEIGDGCHAFAIDVEGLDGAAARRVEVRAGAHGLLLPRAEAHVFGKAVRLLNRPARRVEGRVESIADGVAVGWAWAPDDPKTRLRAAVRVDGTRVAMGKANRPAPGLATMGIGDGRHAFAIELPAELDDGGLHLLAVRCAGTELPFISDWNATGAGVWGETRFVARRKDALAIASIPDDAPEPPGPGAPLSVASLSEPLEKIAGALHELQVRYLVAVVPPKPAVHRELAPAPPPGDHEQRHAVALVRAARDLEHLEVLDLLPALRDATAHGELFYARDDGLNARGAFFAHRALLKHAGLSTRGLIPLSLERASFAPKRVMRSSDLEEPPMVADAAALESLRMPAEAHLEIANLPAPRVYKRDVADEIPRVVLLGHPVIHELTPWIADTTSRLVVLSTHEPPLEQIELELPDLVLHVLDERLLAA